MKPVKCHFEEFANSVDLDGISRTVESKKSIERLFWAFTLLIALAFSLYFTVNFITGYVNDSPFSTNFNVQAMNLEGNGLVPFPDLLICTSSPWDMDKISMYNISMDLVSYMTGLLFPFIKWDDPSRMAGLNDLEVQYNKLLNAKFDGNAMNLLKNITFTCERIIDFCFFGFNTFYPGPDCCQKFFKPSEFGFVFMCLRSNEKLAYTVQEAGILTSIMISIHVEDKSIANLNKGIINQAAALASGMTSFGVASPAVATYLTTSSLKTIGPATYNTLTFQKSLLDQTDKSSFMQQYSCIDNTDPSMNAKLTPGYPAYTKENCELADKQALAAQLLNCSLIYFPSVTGTRYCSPKDTTSFFTNLR